MKIIIFGATGFIGQNVVPALLQANHEIMVVGRSQSKITQQFGKTVQGCTWDNFIKCDASDYGAIINLVGENIDTGRWTENIKQEIINSRVQAAERIIAWVKNATGKKPHLYNASAIGVYGLQTVNVKLPNQLTEANAVSGNAPTDFLQRVGQAWEKAAFSAESFMPVTVMRFAVVLKKDAALLKKLALPFSLGLGARFGTGNQAFTWIHIEDLVRGILHLINHPEIQGSINLCAPQCVSQYHFAQSLAKVMHRPLLFTMPAFVIKLIFGQMGEELILAGQNVYPEKLLNSGFQFTYPNIDSALKREWA